MDTDEDLTVWCGNLPKEVDEELLYELFLQVAPLKKVRIPTDKTGKYLNYGFVTFKQLASVQYAIDMFNNIQLYDRTIIVRSRNANNANIKNQQQQQQQQQLQSPVMLMPMMGGGMGMLPLPILQLPQLQMMPLVASPQHDYHAKDRGRHGHNNKPYRQHQHRGDRDRSTSGGKHWRYRR